MDVPTVLARLVAAAATAVSTPVLKMTAYAYVPDDVEAPCVYPDLKPIKFDVTMGRGTDEMTVGLIVLCARTDDRAGQRMLQGYLSGSGSSSVKAAIEAARGVPGVGALAGACDDLHVQEVSEPRQYEHAGEKYYGAEFTVHIFGSGA